MFKKFFWALLFLTASTHAVEVKPLISQTVTGDYDNPVTIAGDFITFQDIQVDWDGSTGNRGTEADVVLAGSDITVDNVDFLGFTDFADVLSHRGGGNRRKALVFTNGGDRNVVQNSDFTFYSGQVIRVQNTQIQHWVIHNNLVAAGSFGDAIRVDASSDGVTELFGRISQNTLYCGATSDCIQSNQSNFGSDPDIPNNFNVVVKNNLMIGETSSQGTNENCIDTKGASSWAVLNNVCWGTTGDNDGSSLGETADRNTGSGFAQGSGQSAEKLLFRGNILYDNSDCLRLSGGGHYIQNTAIGCNRDFNGSNQGSPGGNNTASPGYMDGVRVDGKGTDNRTFFGNIVGESNDDDVVYDNWPSVYVDYNIYSNAFDTPTFEHRDVSNNMTLAEIRTQLQTEGASTGDEANSVIDDPEFSSVTEDPTGAYVAANWLIEATSPAVDFLPGIAQATANSSGTTVTVGNGACRFYDGLGITGETGDYIIIAATAEVQIVDADCDAGTIEIAASRSVTSGDWIWQTDGSGNKYDDAGACQRGYGDCPTVGQQ